MPLDDRGAGVVTVLAARMAPPRAAWLGLAFLALLVCVVVPATADEGGDNDILEDCEVLALPPCMRVLHRALGHR